MKNTKTNYFCQDCFKTYTEYYKNGKFTNEEGDLLTEVYGKCDECGGKLVVD